MEESSNLPIQLNYIVEHFETEVSQWTVCEYVHMILVLSNLYTDAAVAVENRLILTNFPYV